MYALNETSRILALLIFPMEIFRMRWGILKKFLKFPLIIFFENANPFNQEIEFCFCINNYLIPRFLNECCKTERFGWDEV